MFIPKPADLSDGEPAPTPLSEMIQPFDDLPVMQLERLENTQASQNLDQVPGIPAQDIPASCAHENLALRLSPKTPAHGQLTAEIAHDFNNLLAIIALNLNIMRVLQQQGRADDLSRYVTTASTATQQAAALMCQLVIDSDSDKASNKSERTQD